MPTKYETVEELIYASFEGLRGYPNRIFKQYEGITVNRDDFYKA